MSAPVRATVTAVTPVASTAVAWAAVAPRRAVVAAADGRKGDELHVRVRPPCLSNAHRALHP